MEQMTLSNGEKIDLKPLTIKQAKECKLSEIIKKIASSVDEEGNLKMNEFDFDEDIIINVVKQVYSKWEDLTYVEALELFGKVIEQAFKKK